MKAEIKAERIEFISNTGDFHISASDKANDTELRKKSKMRHLVVLDPTEYSYNDRGTSELFAKLYRDELRYCTTAKEWYYYRDGVWTKDNGGMAAHALAKEFFDCLIEYSISIDDEKTRQAFYSYYIKLGSKAKRDIIIKDAADCLYISNTDFDSNVNFLNFRNGTLELDTFKFREHRPEDLITKTCNAEYDPAAKSAQWEKFISDVLPKDREKQEFLQKALGYSLTGNPHLERFFILYGATTRNGKTTLLSTIEHALGDYAIATPPETIAIRKRDSSKPSEDLARLYGKRFLNLCEPPQSMPLDVALVKAMTGGATITARFLNENSFDYKPIFSVFMDTNYLPRVADDTLFASNRVNVITFDRHFTASEQDVTLKQKLRTPENISGIINWMLAGLKLYRSEGLNLPISVAVASREYATASDKIQNFIDECLEEETDAVISAKAVYETYREWCTTSGMYADGKQKFLEQLRKKNLLSDKGTVNSKTVKNVIKGYILANTD